MNSGRAAAAGKRIALPLRSLGAAVIFLSLWERPGEGASCLGPPLHACPCHKHAPLCDRAATVGASRDQPVQLLAY